MENRLFLAKIKNSDDRDVVMSSIIDWKDVEKVLNKLKEVK